MGSISDGIIRKQSINSNGLPFEYLSLESDTLVDAIKKIQARKTMIFVCD